MDSSSTPHANETEPPEADDFGAASGSKRKTRSFVWEHFTKTKEDNEKCRCHYCGLIMCCKSTSGTTSLKNHLLLACKAYKAWNETQNQTQKVINPVSEDGNTTLSLAKVTESVFREACNEMVVLGQLALSFLESLAWRHFCNKVKLFKPHSRRSATRDIVEMYSKRKLSMMKLIGNKQRVSLTTDIWTAPTTKCSYMVITAHFIDEFWKLRKLIIGFKNVTDHTGATISSVLVECMAEWGIKKLFTITVDNATANTSALKKFKEAYTLLDSNSLVLGGEYMHMRCCAHIINLVVKDGFNEVDSSVQAIRNAVLYVRASTNRVKAFELRVESGKMTRGSLTLDCQTRWNSTYLMLTRALKFRKAFEKTEAEDKLYNEHFQETVEGKKRIGPPTVDDWDAVERLVKFLIIFYNSTLVVSASTSVSSTKCYNEIVTIERNLIKLSNDSDESLRSKARAMRQKFDKYWDGLKEMNRLLIVASIFDPRHKMKFAEMCFDKLYGKDSVEAIDLKRSVKSVLTRLFEEYNAGLTTAGNNTTSQSSSHSQTLSAEDQVVGDVELDTEEGYERMDCLYNEMADERGFEDEGTELDIYLEEKCEKRKGIQMAGVEFDLLGWWKVNSIKFPVLSAIARDILAMQVSSVASESAFSTSGRVVTPARSSLTHYTIEVLMCLEQWLKCEYHLNDKGLVTKEQLLADIELQDELQREFESAVSGLTI